MLPLWRSSIDLDLNPFFELLWIRWFVTRKIEFAGVFHTTFGRIITEEAPVRDCVRLIEGFKMRTSATAALFLLFAVLTPSAAHAQATCRPETNRADALRSDVVRLVTTTNTKLAALRDSLRLPSARSTDVAILTDSTICAKAAAAMARATSTESAPVVYPVWVVRVGTTRYVVYGPDYKHAGEFSDYVIFDSHFKYLATWAG